jgi:hypothetical protein
MINFSRKTVNKNVKQKKSKCGARQYGEGIIIIIIIIIQLMWNVKCFFIPVCTGATGTVTEGLKKSVHNTRKVLDRFSTKNSRTRNITHNNASATV